MKNECRIVLNQIRQLNFSEASGSQNPKVMAEAEKKGCVQSDLIVNVKRKVTPRFKAGAELVQTVNAVEIGWDESHECDSTVLNFHIPLNPQAI